MEVGRREFLKYLTATAVIVTPSPACSQGANYMYGLIVKMTAGPGKREELVTILKEGTGNMPGCLSYVVANDSADENAVWITEVWDGVTSHDASLSLPSVKSALARAKPLISGFERVAVTNPVGGVGLRSASGR